ncbi:hypothetical protein P5V15_011633 [Pogonomyrmex californicus]
MSVPTFVDLQGFLFEGQFVVKEFAALKEQTVLSHYIFANLIPWHFLTNDDVVIYVKGHEKRKWLRHLLLDDDSVLYDGETKKERNAISVEPRAVRLLSRRYNLTGFKFLEILINVSPPSYVEIALGDHRGQELILSLETWKGLHEQQWNIYKLLRKNYKDTFISIGPSLMNDERCYTRTS